MADPIVLTQDELDKIKADASAKAMASATPNTHFAISKQMVAIIGVVGFMAIMLAKQFGWITDSQATQLELLRQQLLAQQQYSTVSVAETKSGGTSVVTVETGGKPAEVKPAAITIDQVKPWLDVFGPIIKKWIEDSKKPPVVTPPTTIPPVNVPPVTNPPVTIPPPINPPATTLKLGMTDATGLPVASSSVPSGKLLFIKLEGFSSGKIVWTKRPTGDVQYGEVSGTQVAAIVLGPGAELDLFVTDYGIQQQVDLRVTANLGGQPPPSVEPPVVVNPPVNPPVVSPPQSKQFTLYVVESADPKNPRSLTTASILNNLGQRNSLKDRGHTVVTKTDKDSDPSVAYVKSQGTPLPALAIYDNATRQFVKSVQLPIDMGMSLILPMGG